MGRPRINPKEFNCLECGKTILNTNGFKIIKFCSNKCYGLFNSKHNQDRLKKIAYKNIAGWNRGLVGFRIGSRPEMQGRTGTSKGRKHTKQSLVKMRISKLGKKRTDLQGKKHWNWKGTSPLVKLIKGTIEYKNWRKQLFTRDNYTCQECFKKGGELHPHHIKPFSNILSDFLKQYSQFSPIEDTDVLIRLAETYNPFWDINNGKTLCEECHHNTETFGSKILCSKK